MKFEMMLGGLLALVVVGAAFVFATSFTPVETPAAGASSGSTVTAAASSTSDEAAQKAALAANFTRFERILADPRCQCYQKGYNLAGTGADVASAQFRTGFKQCRALADPKAGNAWTDGWNARLSADGAKVDCPAYFRRMKIVLD